MLQAIGSISIHKIMDRYWLIASIIFGVIGLLLLLIRRGNLDFESSTAPESEMFWNGKSEYTGSRFSDLIDKLGEHHD
jgi:hypothetical protein